MATYPVVQELREGDVSQSRVKQALTATKEIPVEEAVEEMSQSRVKQALTATLERSRLIHKALNFKNPANKNICDSKPHGCRLCSIALERQ